VTSKDKVIKEQKKMAPAAGWGCSSHRLLSFSYCSLGITVTTLLLLLLPLVLTVAAADHPETTTTIEQMAQDETTQQHVTIG
jgi:hypothetical protein